jgi:hypothetical protein
MVSILARSESSRLLHMGTPKTLVYAAPVDKEEALHHHLVDVCQTYIFWQSRRLFLSSGKEPVFR